MPPKSPAKKEKSKAELLDMLCALLEKLKLKAESVFEKAQVSDWSDGCSGKVESKLRQVISCYNCNFKLSLDA